MGGPLVMQSICRRATVAVGQVSIRCLFLKCIVPRHSPSFLRPVIIYLHLQEELRVLASTYTFLTNLGSPETLTFF